MKVAHSNVTLLPNDKYVLDGETAVHDDIENLVNYYTEVRNIRPFQVLII